MAVIEGRDSLEPREFPDAPEWMSGLFERLSVYMGNTQNSLKNLTISDNINAAIVDFPGAVVPGPTWLVAPFSNTWVDFAAGYQTQRYRSLPGGAVELDFMVKRTGAPAGGETIFTLPVGYRPELRVIRAAYGDSGAGAFDVLADGTVVYRTGAAAGTFFSGWTIFQAVTTGPCALPASWTGNGWPISLDVDVSGPCRGIQLVSAIDRTGGQFSAAVGISNVSWENIQDGRVRIRAVHGLQPGRTYDLTFIAWGD